MRETHATSWCRTETQPATTLGCFTSSPGIMSPWNHRRVSVRARIETRTTYNDTLSLILLDLDIQQTQLDSLRPCPSLPSHVHHEHLPLYESARSSPWLNPNTSLQRKGGHHSSSSPQPFHSIPRAQQQPRLPSPARRHSHPSPTP